MQNLSKGTLAAPGLYFSGDSNLGLASTAADVLDLVTAGTRAFQVASASAAVNYLLATPGNAAQWPTLSAQGSDTNIGVRLEGKGTGYVSARRGQSVGQDFYPSFGIFDEPVSAGPAGVLQIATGTIDLVAGGRRVLQASAYVSATNYLRVTPSQAGQPVLVDAAGGDTTQTITLGTTTGEVRVATRFVPASLYGTVGPNAIPTTTPVADALYRDNLIKAWCCFDGTPAPNASLPVIAGYNVASIYHGSAGHYQIVFARTFISTNYGVFGMANMRVNNDFCVPMLAYGVSDAAVSNATDDLDKSTTGCGVRFVNSAAGGVDPRFATIICLGSQS